MIYAYQLAENILKHILTI